MKNTCHLTNDWALRVFTVEQARDILGTSGETLCKTYEVLTDEQKIAFILTGGVPTLSQWPQTKTDSAADTGQLPVLC